MHAHRFVDAEQREDMIEDRHDDDAAADAEKAREDAGDKAGDDEPGRKRREFHERHGFDVHASVLYLSSRGECRVFSGFGGGS
ncbi:MAG: hypothetical protein AMXMBFR74_19170 [Parvibaculum sp.]